MHTRMMVYKEMLLTVRMNYSSLPNPLSMDEVEFYYNGIRESLKKATKPTE